MRPRSSRWLLARRPTPRKMASRDIATISAHESLQILGAARDAGIIPGAEAGAGAAGYVVDAGACCSDGGGTPIAPATASGAWGLNSAGVTVAVVLACCAQATAYMAVCKDGGDGPGIRGGNWRGCRWCAAW